jgi:hypothetical protein
VARELATRASRRPKTRSTTLRATCVERTRSAGAWKVPTFSAREWRRAAPATDGANGSCTWTTSRWIVSSSSSSVRATSTGSPGARRRDAVGSSGSTSPTARTSLESSSAA